MCGGVLKSLAEKVYGEGGTLGNEGGEGKGEGVVGGNGDEGEEGREEESVTLETTTSSQGTYTCIYCTRALGDFHFTSMPV